MNNQTPIAAGILGGGGYGGVELIRILARHPQVRLHTITSRSEAGRAVGEVFPWLRGAVELSFVAPQEAALSQCDVVFAATPNGVAMTFAESLLDAGVKLIDLSADFRLSDAAVWRNWYGVAHACPALLSRAVYGLPELNRAAIAKAQLVANPGCYSTAVLLGLLPLIESGAAQSTGLIADAKSGVSGAGRAAQLATAMSEVGESFAPYALSGHRHLPEICQQLNQLAGRSVELTFAPHLLPMIRGICATLYARLSEQGRDMDLQSLYENRFADEPFVDVLPPGAHPQTRSVRGANVCRLAVHRPQQGEVAVVASVIDNLVKGAAGQAVQNMNLLFNLPETAGLTDIALAP